ncbi:hypothetical protein [Marinoscillum furvescens]|uniref:Outer membrane protein with beta-barrel domain n=1 Tax=Marinoscillum furvescens DSM 4134 TaxID=1122208 RepID=A0A3D9L0M8_MARFU|nr:hypothetical protein [Marinoscillum furvescens]RED95999.1 hypothetical protein C7460_11657 [Marinoscillum furvescens DSM 4134]
MRFNILSSILLLSFAASAQKLFDPGYIIQNGDTIRGEIKRTLIGEVVNSCEFKATPEAKPVTYLSSQIDGFGFTEGLHYEAAQVDITGVPKSVFLERILTGPMNLYLLDFEVRDYFFVTSNGEILELKYNEVTIVDKETGKTFKKFMSDYKGLLLYLFQDFDQMTLYVESATYTYNSLVRVVKKYNKLVCPECSESKNRENDYLMIEPSVGIRFFYTQLGRKDESIYTSKIHSDIFGLRFTKVRARSNYRLATGVGVFFTHHDHKFYPEFYIQGQDYILHRYNLVEVPLSVEYFFGKRQLKGVMRAQTQIGYMKDGYSATERVSTFTGRKQTETTSGSRGVFHLGGALSAGLIFIPSENIYFRIDATGWYNQSLYQNNIYAEYAVPSWSLTAGLGVRLNSTTW